MTTRPRTSTTGTSAEDGTHLTVPPRWRPITSVPFITTSTPVGTIRSIRSEHALWKLSAYSSIKYD